MDQTDEQLVQACLSGDKSAFDLLVSRWDRRIQGAIYRLVGSEEDARDLSQEAFLKAYKGLPSFKGQARFSSWLYQIALNLCRDRMRRRRGRTLVSLDALLETGEVALPERGATAFELVQSRDVQRRVAAAVAALSEEQREVIVLKEYQELTFFEISEVLGLPVSTVKTRLYRGLQQLRERLTRQGMPAASPLPAQAP